jgi:beta-glucosidase
MEGGKAVADLLFGDICPSGKLPLTFPKSLDQLPDFEDYSMEGRTYRYMTEEPLYPFGFGLSYSNFTYSHLSLDKLEVNAGESIKVSVNVQNTGIQSGAEVVQFYLSDLEASTIVPITKLVGFERVALAVGESRVIPFSLTAEKMSYFNEQGKLTLDPGEFRLEVGGCSPGERGQDLGAPVPQITTFKVL